MGYPGIHVAESIVGDNFGGSEVLELGGIGSNALGKSDQHLGTFQIAVMIRRNVGDEVRGLARPNCAACNLEFHSSLPLPTLLDGRQPACPIMLIAPDPLGISISILLMELRQARGEVRQRDVQFRRQFLC